MARKPSGQTTHPRCAAANRRPDQPDALRNDLRQRNAGIAVNSPTGTLWRTQTKETQIAHAGRSLESGVHYSLVVTTNTGRSSNEDQASSGELAQALDFRVLRPAEVTDIQTFMAKLLQSKPMNETMALTLATYYSDCVLPASAITAYGLTQDNYAKLGDQQ